MEKITQKPKLILKEKENNKINEEKTENCGHKESRAKKKLKLSIWGMEKGFETEHHPIF